MMEWLGQWNWWIALIGLCVGIVITLVGYAGGRRSMRRRITGDFDVIIRRARSYMANGQLMQLDQFLHELTEDEPYVPSMKMLADNMIRTGGNGPTHNEHESRRHPD